MAGEGAVMYLSQKFAAPGLGHTNEPQLSLAKIFFIPLTVDTLPGTYFRGHLCKLEDQKLAKRLVTSQPNSATNTTFGTPPANNPPRL